MQAEKSLDFVQRGLREYLESKRAQFARFYFLANEDLLEILSQTKEVRNVQPHLGKVFENLVKVEFTADNRITHMYSGEKECIQFDEAVNPHDKGVEFWMGELEEMMFKSIRSVLLKSIEDYENNARPEWMLCHPGQCVLNGSQVWWTKEVEEAMNANKLADYATKLQVQISETVKKVQQEVTKLQSITIGALITIDVHARDVVNNLVDAGITDVAAFDWIS